jgi:hypothetical protein
MDQPPSLGFTGGAALPPVREVLHRRRRPRWQPAERVAGQLRTAHAAARRYAAVPRSPAARGGAAIASGQAIVRAAAAAKP